MRPLPIFTLAVILAAQAAFAQSASTNTSPPTKRELATPAATAPEPEKDSPLVRASKLKKAKKAKIEIDNNTVKKTTGKLTISKERPGSRPEDQAALAEQRSRNEAFDNDLKQWQKSVTETKEKVTALNEEIANLERVVLAFEENYYNEDDPGLAEAMDEKYQKAYRQLERAREELANTRQQQEELDRSKPRS